MVYNPKLFFYVKSDYLLLDNGSYGSGSDTSPFILCLCLLCFWLYVKRTYLITRPSVDHYYIFLLLSKIFAYAVRARFFVVYSSFLNHLLRTNLSGNGHRRLWLKHFFSHMVLFSSCRFFNNKHLVYYLVRLTNMEGGRVSLLYLGRAIVKGWREGTSEIFRHLWGEGVWDRMGMFLLSLCSSSFFFMFSSMWG